MLAIGRFGFLPYQRRQIEKAGLPLQNDVTNLQAGMSEGLATDKLATEAKAFETKDPAGFTLIDTIAWDPWDTFLPLLFWLQRMPTTW